MRRRIRVRNLCLLGLLLSLLGPSGLLAEDWPQWRGQNRDAVLHEAGRIQPFSSGPLPRRWSVPIGSGYSGPTVSAGRVYVTDLDPGEQQTQIERILCFDVEDGSLQWSHNYPAPYRIDYTAGPRASSSAAVTSDP